MRKIFCLGLLAGLFASASTNAVTNSTQAIIVITPDWTSITGRLVCVERSSASDAWRVAGASNRPGRASALAFAITVGKIGLGWGAGIHPKSAVAGPAKHEGDGRSPAGIFKLGTAFGYAPASDVPWIHLPYQQCTSELKCVDDAKSASYNTLVRPSSISKKDWDSFEDMRRADNLYRLGVFVEHNTNPKTSGGGSCIFLHIWQGREWPTTGCTAMPTEKIETLLRWLKTQHNPLLIQLPIHVYHQLVGEWKLPATELLSTDLAE